MTDFSAKEEEKLKKALVTAILPSLVNDLHNSGKISDADLSDKHIVNQKIREFLNSKNSPIFSLTVDHRSTILSLAELQNKEGHQEFSISLYATFVEHTLNSIIHHQCFKKKFDEKTKLEILRSVNLIGKCGWLIKVLGLPPLKSDHVKTILAIADERNSFFHYKWKPDPDTDKIRDLDREEKLHAEKIKKVKALIKYLKNYETKLEFGGKKKKIISAAL
jgi:hypothetical protein